MKKIILASLGILGLWTNLAKAEANVVGAFLQNGTGGRSSGMADCYSAVAEGPFGAWYNPAGLAVASGAELGAQFESLSPEVVHNTLAGVVPLGPGSMSGLLSVVNYGTLEKRSEDGALTGESITPSDGIFSLGYGLPLSEAWNLGANVGVYNSNLGTVKWSGVTADLGTLWHVHPAWSIGAVVKNIGTGHDGFALPALARVAGAYTAFSQRLVLDAEVEVPFGKNEPELGLGAEFRIWDWLALRAGFKNALPRETSQDSLVMGLGFNLGSFGADLSFMNRGDLGLRSNLSLGYAFGHSQHEALDAFKGKAGDEKTAQLEAKTHALEEKNRELEKRAKALEAQSKGTKAAEVNGHMQEDPKRQAEFHYKAGQEYEKYNRYIDAIVEYKAALKLNPQYPEAQKALGLVTRKAEQELSNEGKSSASAPTGDSGTMQKSIRKHYELGLAAYNGHDYSAAIKELQLVLELTTQHQEAMELLRKAEAALHSELRIQQQLASAAAERGDLAGEIIAYQKMLDLEPGNAKIEAKLKTAQQKVPKLVDDLYKSGVDQYAKMQYREALKIFETLLKLQPDHVKAKDAVKNIKEKLVQTGQ